MKITLLARNPHLYSHRRICEAARARGHDIEVLNTLRVSINITSRRPMLFYRKRRLEDFDAVIPRIGASITFYGLAVLRQFEVMGVYPLNESVAIGRSRDKLRCLQLLARRGIGLPVTAYTNDPKQAEDIIDLVGGAPVVIKLLEGTQGIGVVLGETAKSAKSVIEAFQGVNVNILVQQFIKEADSTDIRALVIGDRVVASMKRQGPPGEFRSNLHRGGSGEKVRLRRKSEAPQ
jgi:ribosomal protein S6--L-glutamate ligase